MSVNLNNFSVTVRTAYKTANSFQRGGATYVRLPHKAEYKLTLKNNRSTKCDAKVFIDGEEVGIWRVNAWGSITVERPTFSARKFTFLKEESSAAEDAGIEAGDNENGLLKVVFTPEKKTERYWDRVGAVKESYGRRNGMKKCKAKASRSAQPERMNFFESRIEPQNATFATALSMNMSNNSFGAEECDCDSFGVASDGFSAGATTLGAHSDQTFRNVSKITNVDTTNITTIYARLVIDETESKPFIALKPAKSSTTFPPPIYETEVPKPWGYTGYATWNS